MTTRVSSIAVVLVLGATGTAHAQDDRKIGLTMGFPAAVGVLWHVSERVAMRPEIDFSRFSATTESTGTSTLFPVDLEDEATSRTVRPAVSALIYLARRDQLRTYVVPRFAYTSIDSSSSDQSFSTYLFSGSFGAQHQFGGQFAIFGELGLEYTRGTSKLSTTLATTTVTLTTRRSSIASRAGVGVVLYF